MTDFYLQESVLDDLEVSMRDLIRGPHNVTGCLREYTSSGLESPRAAQVSFGRVYLDRATSAAEKEERRGRATKCGERESQQKYMFVYDDRQKGRLSIGYSITFMFRNAWSNVNGPWKLDTFCFYASMNHLARCVSGFVSRIGVVGDWFFAIEASRIRVRSCRIRSWPSIYSNN